MIHTSKYYINYLQFLVDSIFSAYFYRLGTAVWNIKCNVQITIYLYRVIAHKSYVYGKPDV